MKTSLSPTLHHVVACASQSRQMVVNEIEHLPTSHRQHILAPCAYASAWIHLAAQPAASFHSLQNRVERARTDVVPVLAQFILHPLSEHGFDGRTTQDMHLPEAQENFADFFLVKASRTRSLDGCVSGHSRCRWRREA